MQQHIKGLWPPGCTPSRKSSRMPQTCCHVSHRCLCCCRDAGGSIRLCHLFSRGGLRSDPSLQQRRAGQVWM